MTTSALARARGGTSVCDESRRRGVVTCVVAIPVCNERGRIVDCLNALAAQVDLAAGGFGILCFLNNCTDGTRRVVDDWVVSSPWPVRLVEQDSPSASAGWARRAAMDAGASWLEESASSGGTLMTTDADSRVAPDWVARNKAALSAGADAVAGRVVFDPAEVALLPAGLRRRQELEAEYETLLAEIEARLAPRRGNPWPCHWTKSGASIAVSLDAYRRVGGIPSLSSGEDRAFIDLIGSHGLVVRHAPDIAVTTSGRLDGRACGGTAETLQGWCLDPDSPCDARLQRLGALVWRVLRRGPVVVDRRPMRPHELPRQIGRAHALLRCLRWLETRRVDRPRVASLSPVSPSRLSLP